jgi:hypothetical protein
MPEMWQRNAYSQEACYPQALCTGKEAIRKSMDSGLLRHGHGYTAKSKQQLIGAIMTDFPLRDKCEDKAGDMNIPHFTILACDNFGIELVRQWIWLAELFKVPQDKLHEARTLYQQMQIWRAQNHALCKIPD